MMIVTSWNMLKAKRANVYALNDGNFGDSFGAFDGKVHICYDRDKVIRDALNYISFQQDDMFYPGKSYAVAAMYAKYVSQLTNYPIRSILDFPDLLNNDDPYFKTYSEDPVVYESIIDYVDKHFDIEKECPTRYTEMTRKYFMVEFDIKDNNEQG